MPRIDVNRTLRIVTGDSQSALLNLAASSDPLVASPALYECAPAPASLPPSTMRYSFRIGRFSNQHSRISRVPAGARPRRQRGPGNMRRHAVVGHRALRVVPGRRLWEPDVSGVAGELSGFE